MVYNFAPKSLENLILAQDKIKMEFGGGGGWFANNVIIWFYGTNAKKMNFIILLMDFVKFMKPTMMFFLSINNMLHFLPS